MAENYVPQLVATFVNDTSAVNVVNSNFTAIATALNDVLSRSGVVPNQMGSTLDMNSNQVINLPFPSTLNSPARLADVTSAQNITIISALTGNSGHTVPFLDGSGSPNTWSTPQVLTLGASGTSTALALNITTGTGTNASGVNINNIQISDSLSCSPQFSNGFIVQQSFGTTSSSGGKQALCGFVNLTSTTSSSSANRDYVAVAGVSQASANDNGTNPNSSGSSAGSFFGGSFVGLASASATSLFAVSGATLNTQMLAGSSVWSKSLLQCSSNPSDVVNGTIVNTMVWLFNQSGATAKWTNAILIDNAAGFGSWPLSSSATLIKTAGGGTVTNGIDISNTTFTGSAYISNGFSVNPSGVVISGGSAISTSGSLQFNGSASGSVTATTNSTGTIFTVNQPLFSGVIGTTAGSLTLAGLTSGSTVLTVSATAGTLLLGAGNFAIFSNGVGSTSGQSMTVAAGTAVPSGGASSTGYLFSSTANFGVFFGTGAPTISAAKGSLYLENGSGNLYINQSGSSTWVQITVP